MSYECERLHRTLEKLPLIRYPFRLEMLPLRGIYFLYEDGEFWGHGGNKPRIVRIGTHRKNNFRSRIADHFMIGRKNNSDKTKPKPSDRSIFRKNIGRALLNKEKDPYLKTWEIDFTSKANRNNFGKSRDIKRERDLEKQITDIIRNKFFLRFIIADEEDKIIGTKGLESKLIGTVSGCNECKPSKNWLGGYSPKQEIRDSGLWLTQHLKSRGVNKDEMKTIERLVDKTLTWIKKNWNEDELQKYGIRKEG